jgi:hypothetical protein
MPHPAGTMPSCAFLSTVYSGDHIENTATFVPPLISIGPECFHLAAYHMVLQGTTQYSW